MSRRKIGDSHIRKITKAGGKSYSITIPIEYVRRLDWQKKQKVIVEMKNKHLVIKDWEE